MIFNAFIDRLLKNELIDRILSFFMGLGLFLYGLMIIILVISQKKELIAPGLNKVFYTVPLFLAFFYYQRHLFIKFFNNPSEEVVKQKLLYKKIAINLSLFLYVIALPIYLLFFNNNNIIMDSSQFLNLLFVYTFGIFFVAGGIFALLYYFLRMGIILTGTNVCIGLHNYFNGQEFDIVPMYSLLAEVALPDFLGILITIVQISLAIFAGKIEDLFS